MFHALTFLTSTLGRYLVAQVCIGLMVAAGTIIGAILLIDSVEQARVFDGEISALTAFGLSLLRLPGLVVQTAPFIMLFGAIFAYAGIARRSELPVIRASGVSAWQFLAPVGALGAVLGIIGTLVLDPLSVVANDQYLALKHTVLAKKPGNRASAPAGIWLRQGDSESQIVIHGGEVVPEQLVLKNVRMFVYENRAEKGAEPVFSFARRYDAAEAALRPGFWQLRDVVENAPPLPPVASPHLSIPSGLKPVAIRESVVDANSASVFALPRLIAETERLGYTADRYRLKFFGLLSQPLMLVAMGVFGGIFSLRSMRQGGVAQLVGIGVLTGFMTYFLGNVAVAMALSDSAPSVIAAFSPPLTALFAALAMVAILEDG